MADNEVKFHIKAEDGASGPIKAVDDALQKNRQYVEAAAQTTDKAASSEQRRAASIKVLETQLKELISEERSHQNTLKKGNADTKKDGQAARDRRQAIDRLSRSLAKLEGEQDAVNQELKRSVNAHRNVEDSTESNSKAATAFSDVMNSSAGAVGALTGGLVGSGGLLVALNILADDLKKNIEVAREFQDAFLNLQFLSDTFNPQEKEFVGKAAVFGGRKPAEVAEALADVKSFFPGKSDQDNQALLLEVLELGRTTPAPLSELASPFLGLVGSGQTPQEAQNTLRATIVQGGVSDPGLVGGLLGEVLTPGQQIGNLSAAESAGIVAGATGLDRRNPEPQITAVKSILLSLLGDKTKEQQQLAEAAGIDDTNFLTAIESLGIAVEQEKINSAGLDRLVGAEGIVTAASLGNPEIRSDFLAKVKAVVAASKSKRDLTADAIQNQFGADPATSLNFAIKQAEAADEVNRASKDVLASDLSVKLLDLELQKEGVGPVRRFMARNTTSALQAVGVSDEKAVEMGSDLVFGATSMPQALTPMTPGEKANQQVDRIEEGQTLPSAFDDRPPELPDDLKPAIEGATSGRVINNWGNIYSGAGNPMFDDLDGRDRI